MKVLSLFDGMACGMIAMLKSGIEVDRYVAYEIDKYAIKTATHNFPMIEQKGDVFNADFTEYEGFDWVLAGFPCTKFSIAQKNGRETKPYSGEGWDLFEQAWRAVQEAKPQYFLLENNKSMAKAVQQEISKIIGFPPVLINSALVSAQNRQRLYWAGKRNPDGSYSKVNVEQPIDRGIFLKDVLDGNTDREKAKAVIGSIGRTTTREYFQKQQGTMAFKPLYIGEIPEHNGQYRNGKQPSQQYRVYSVEGKSVAIDRDNRKNIAEPVRVGSLPRPNGELSTSQAMRVYSTDGKSVNITASGGGMGGKTGLYAIPVEFDGDIPIKAISQADGKTYRVYKVENGIINIKGKDYPIKLADGYYIIRKLTVRECMRLQTVPEWYEFPVSDAQSYKMLRNGWTCDVIVHLIRSCVSHKNTKPEIEQLTFF